jgi:uncharacterized protein YjbI with pentapeptide repeats
MLIVANPEHLAKLSEGVEAWNDWTRQNRLLKPELRGARLQGANLAGAHLWGADLQGAQLQGANLSGAGLHNAFLTQANLSDADLSEADMLSAYVRGAHLCRANLHRASLLYADLQMADFSGADLSNSSMANADLYSANLSGANLTGAHLDLASLIRTNLERANLTDCSVYGVSAWDVKLAGAIQSNLVITPSDQSAIQVDNLEVAQFIYLLLNNEKIRTVIDTIGKKAVLILGRFTPERKPILDAIREALRRHDYLPILFDFEKPSTRDTQETITTLAGMSRFIIADITDPKSIPAELASIVPNLPSVPVQPLLQTGFEPWGMYDHIKRYPWVLDLVNYDSQAMLVMDLNEKVIVPAEQKATQQTRK